MTPVPATSQGGSVTAPVGETAVWDHSVFVPPTGQAGEWFDVHALLGARGYKYLPKACQYLVATGRAVTRGHEELIGRIHPDARAAVVGTNAAVSALHDSMDRQILETGANDLSPAWAPYFSVNLIASRLSNEFDLKGFNITTTTPLVAGIEAVALAARSLALGRSELALAGAAEAPPVPASPTLGPLCDGAALLLLAEAPSLPNGRTRPRAYCRVATGFAPRTADAAQVRGILGGLVASVRPAPGCDVRVVVEPSVALELVLAATASAGQPVLSTAVGALAPLVQALDAVAVGRDVLVIAVAAAGHLGALALRRASDGTTPDGTTPDSTTPGAALAGPEGET